MTVGGFEHALPRSVIAKRVRAKGKGVFETSHACLPGVPQLSATPTTTTVTEPTTLSQR